LSRGGWVGGLGASSTPPPPCLVAARPLRMHICTRCRAHRQRPFMAPRAAPCHAQRASSCPALPLMYARRSPPLVPIHAQMEGKLPLPVPGVACLGASAMAAVVMQAELINRAVKPCCLLLPVALEPPEALLPPPDDRPLAMVGEGCCVLRCVARRVAGRQQAACKRTAGEPRPLAGRPPTMQAPSAPLLCPALLPSAAAAPACLWASPFPRPGPASPRLRIPKDTNPNPQDIHQPLPGVQGAVLLGLTVSDPVTSLRARKVDVSAYG
jgi:hypothetical protein